MSVDHDTSPMTEPIELSYHVHLLPPGRISFRRWRWELWHGPHLLAAGWRLSVLHAQRAVRSHALRYAHRLHGLHPLRTDAAAALGQPLRADAAAPEKPWGGNAVTLAWGDLKVVLTPRPRLDAARRLASSTG
jgi:hypothetical protein